MASKSFSVSSSSPTVDVFIDTGNPILNRIVDGFLKIGTVGIEKSAVEETFQIVQRGSVSKNSLENSLKQMYKEGAYWGSIAGDLIGDRSPSIQTGSEIGHRQFKLINKNYNSSLHHRTPEDLTHVPRRGRQIR